LDPYRFIWKSIPLDYLKSYKLSKYTFYIETPLKDIEVSSNPLYEQKKQIEQNSA